MFVKWNLEVGGLEKANEEDGMETEEFKKFEAI